MLYARLHALCESDKADVVINIKYPSIRIRKFTLKLWKIYEPSNFMKKLYTLNLYVVSVYGNVASLYKCRIRVLNLRLQGFGNTSDLVDFEQQAVASLLLHCVSNAFGVGDSKVISHHLYVRAVGKIGPGLPIILIKGVLNGDH